MGIGGLDHFRERRRSTVDPPGRRDHLESPEVALSGLPALVKGGPALLAGALQPRTGSILLALQRRAGNGATSSLVRSVPYVQRTLNANGERAGFASLVNGILAVQLEVVVGAGGAVSLRTTDVQGPPTPAAQELASVLRSVIGDSHATVIKFVRGSGQVVVGSYLLSTLDLADMEAFGEPGGRGLNAGTAMAHEILEQYRKQVHREAYPVAHAAGLASEARAAGATITPGPMVQVNPSTVEIQDIYEYPDGKREEVTIVLTGNNVTAVRRRALP